MTHRVETGQRPEIRDVIRRYLACPLCHSSLEINLQTVACVACDFRSEIREDIFLSKPCSEAHYFDDMHEVMLQGNQDHAVWRLCYEQQARHVEKTIKPDSVVLDVGCGPATAYDKQPGWFVIGVDPSYKSLLANHSVDLRVYGSAERLPIADRSVDAVLCFYSVHHMIGQTTQETREIVSRVFGELNRVIRVGGSLYIFDMSPWWPFSTFEHVMWNTIRRALGTKLDMFFWEASDLAKLGQKAFPGSTLRKESYKISPFLSFPPVFGLPWLKVPRFLYPFDVNVYHWKF